MAINYVTVKGYLKDGKIEVDLPENALEGEVELRVAVDIQLENQPEPLWTDEELAKLIKPDPKPGAEIVALGHTGGWEHKGIEDSVEWVKEQRRQRREQRGW